MEYHKLLDKRFTCIADAPPPCAGVCPLNLDVRDFIRKAQAGLFSASYKTLLRYAVLPGIVCHVCKEPCKSICPRGSVDSAVSIRELELYCWRENHLKPQRSFYSPEKPQRILIIGSSPIGIACAIKLADRHYAVDLVEADDKLGGRLNRIAPAILPAEVLSEEMQRLYSIKHLYITTGKRAELPTVLPEGYAAVFIAARTEIPEGNISGVIPWKDGIFYTPADEHTKEVPEEIFDGIGVSYMIEEYAKINNVVHTGLHKPASGFIPDTSTIAERPAISGNAATWSTDDAKREAARCVLCSCAKCYNVCDMLKYYRQDFTRLAQNISDTVISTRTSEKKIALYPIMSCDQCGACVDLCPAGIDIRELCLESRRVMHENAALPDARYEYWLSDMRHAGSDDASLLIPAEGAEYLFFPGCQLGATNPEYVTKAYSWLRDAFCERVALLLGCCGAPALWAGNRALYQDALEALKQSWEKLGKPTVILACTTCAERFREDLPEIPFVFLYELMNERLLPSPPKDTTLAVFDPCSGKGFPELRQTIRELIVKSGYAPAEPRKRADENMCCGYGGLIYAANPILYQRINKRNAALSEHPFVTYCANCNDTFLLGGKESMHILELLLPIESRGAAEADERRENRAALRSELAREYLHSEPNAAEAEHTRIKLLIPPELKEKLNAQLILEDNLRRVICDAERTGRKSYSEQTGLYTAYGRQGLITFWVAYKPADGAYEIASAYYHRLVMTEGEA